jgi:DNA polymerase-3 subunit beta
VALEVGSEENHQAIVPRKGVLEVLRLGAGEEEVRVEIGAQAMRVTVGAVRMTCRLVEGRFPEYERVIPDPSVWDKHLVADREELRQGLVRAAVLANERYRAVRLAVAEGRVRIQSDNAEKEEAEEEVCVSYSGPPMEIGFNVAYLVDALSVVQGEQVRLCLNDDNSSCLILANEGGEDCRYVVMPMRL